MAATYNNGPRTQFATSEGGPIPSTLFIRDVKDFMPKLKRQDVVFTKLFETAPAPDQPMMKAEWSWGEPDAWESTITEAIANDTDNVITVADGSLLQLSDRIWFATGEEMLVLAITDNTVQVRRGYADTTAAAVDDNATFYILGSALVEHADDPDSTYTLGQSDYNYHQIMDFTWSMSHRAEVTPHYASDGKNAFQSEMRKKMSDTAPLRMELTYLLGSRYLGSTTLPSAMGGLNQQSYFSTRTPLSSEPLDMSSLEGLLEDINMISGDAEMPNYLITSHLGCRIISSWFNPTRQTSGTDEKFNLKFTEIDTWFGKVRLVPNYIMNKVQRNVLYVMDPGKIKKRPYDSKAGWNTGEYHTQGWHRRGFLRSDTTLIAQAADWRGVLYDWSQTETDYPNL